MKFIALTLLLIFFYAISFAQVNIKKGDSCTCEISIVIKAPEPSEEDTVSATVIVELMVDSNCIYSNPVITKGASKARNKSALAFANDYMIAANRCKRKCPVFHCEQGKKELPIRFDIDE